MCCRNGWKGEESIDDDDESNDDDNVDDDGCGEVVMRGDESGAACDGSEVA